MAQRCNRENCDCAVSIVEFSGPTDPAEGDAVELYECARGHQFTEYLKA